jgi:hypothetical protein
MRGAQAGAQVRRGESREEIVARVLREQQALHPVPVYDTRSRSRLKRYLYAIWPIGIATGLLLMWAVGWSLIEGLGFGVAFAVALWYLGFVMVTERDDGRIARSVARLRDGHPPADG